MSTQHTVIRYAAFYLAVCGAIAIVAAIVVLVAGNREAALRLGLAGLSVGNGGIWLDCIGGKGEHLTVSGIVMVLVGWGTSASAGVLSWIVISQGLISIVVGISRFFLRVVHRRE